MVEAFNRRYHLPRYIIMVLDKDLIEGINFYEHGESMVIGRMVNWISREIGQALEARSEDLYGKKPGATYMGTKTI